MRVSGAMLVGIILVLACPRHDTRSLASKLNSEFVSSVPPGSSKDRVKEFLRSRGIQAYDAKGGRVLNASIPDVEKGVLVRSGVYMTFWFDSSDRLLRHEIKAIATGP